MKNLTNLTRNSFPWGHTRRFNSYTEYMRKTFGGRIQKVVVDAGFTCPNRDGSKGTGGCAYCDNNSFNPSYCDPREPLHYQISKGILFHKVRYRRAQHYLVYFQPYSNTYAPFPVLKKLYREALEYPGVKGLVLGTRPDCVEDELLGYLQELSQNYHIQIEYGVESCYDTTLRRINRGHGFAIAEAMIRKTASLGIKTGAHFIFGLPGETREMMLATAKIISGLSLDSVKFHQLQIVKGTPMEDEFQDDTAAFVQFSLPEYVSFMVDFVERLTPSVVIERFSGEVPPRFLHQSSWGLIRYDAVLRMIEAELERRDSWQGKLIS